MHGARGQQLGENSGASEAAAALQCGSERKVLHISTTGNGLIPLIPYRTQREDLELVRALCCWYQSSPPRRDAGERSGEYTRAGFKKSCSRVQILTLWRAWKTLDPQKDKAAY